MSAGPYSTLDWPYRIAVRTKSTQRKRDANSNWVLESESGDTVITGNFQVPGRDDAADSLQRVDGGMIKEGDAVLFTSTVLETNDEVDVDFDADGTERVRFLVVAKLHTHGLMARYVTDEVRHEYHLKRRA